MIRSLAFVAVALLFVVPAHAQNKTVAVGAGSYATARPARAKGPPDTIYATDAVKGKMPTNDWWSSLAWMPFSERQYPHPLAVQAEAGGLRIYYPGNNITANKDAIFGFMPPGGGADLVIGHDGQEKFPDARVHSWSDWFVTAQFADGDNKLTCSYGHGSPYVFARYAKGKPVVRFAKTPEVWSGDAKSAVLGVTVGGKQYALFAPTGATWSGLDSNQFTCESDRGYFSVAILPDKSPKTLALFQKYAYAHVTDTKVAWKFDEKTSMLTTTFTVTTENMEGEAKGTLSALYPHQWRHTKARLVGLEYNSVRGVMELVEGASFETNYKFSGILPGLPKAEASDAEVMVKLLQAEADAKTPGPRDTYWEGKWLGKNATLIPIAEQYGQKEVADKLRTRIRERLENWLTASEGEQGTHFAYDEKWGTLIGYPASYGSDNELNDHHFHYGYYFRAAAEVARHDPAWAKPEKWGGMIELLVRDVTSPDENDPLFPRLRNFDPYAGHTWASGHAKFGDGNNNESSSEAMNAWYGLIQWGQFTHNTKLRDLGIYLYVTEMRAIHEYWFDIVDENHPPSYTPSVVTMIWGGKGANGTWFSANPEAVHGINWLPIHAGSLYLGHSRDYVYHNYESLLTENKGDKWDQWADLIWMFEAFINPADAMKQYEAAGPAAKMEEGNSRANTYAWITAMQSLGQVNAHVTADHVFYGVFDQRTIRTYIVYNDTDQPKKVTFSDGFVLVADKPGLQTATRDTKK